MACTRGSGSTEMEKAPLKPLVTEQWAWGTQEKHTRLPGVAVDVRKSELGLECQQKSTSWGRKWEWEGQAQRGGAEQVQRPGSERSAGVRLGVKAGPGHTWPCGESGRGPRGMGDQPRPEQRRPCAGGPQNLTVPSVAWALLQQCHLGACRQPDSQALPL